MVVCPKIVWYMSCASLRLLGASCVEIAVRASTAKCSRFVNNGLFVVSDPPARVQSGVNAALEHIRKESCLGPAGRVTLSRSCQPRNSIDGAPFIICEVNIVEATI